MLLWEPKGRGQKTPNQPGGDRQRPYCFEFLDQILTMKVYSPSGMFLQLLYWSSNDQYTNFKNINGLRIVMFMKSRDWKHHLCVL